MNEPVTRHFDASDGYPFHVTQWSTEAPPNALCVIIHGVQSHAGWYPNLGRTLAGSGIETYFPDRRGSGSNDRERGHCPSSRRLIDDVVEFCHEVRQSHPGIPLVLTGISWGGKLVVGSAAREPTLIDGIALICPGLQPRVGVSTAERLKIALAFFTNRRARFPIPLADPALFTNNPDGQQFIAEDPLGLRDATAGLLAASTFLDRRARKAPPKIHQPNLLMLAGQDRIVDNERTLAFVRRLASRDSTVIDYPEAHHTLEFEADPDRYALDLASWITFRWGS